MYWETISERKGVPPKVRRLAKPLNSINLRVRLFVYVCVFKKQVGRDGSQLLFLQGSLIF